MLRTSYIGSGALQGCCHLTAQEIIFQLREVNL